MKGILIFLLVSSLFSCGKLSDSGCYSRELERNHSEGCLTVYDPVCGCDGKNYSSPCNAEAAGITEYTQGQCD